MGFLDQFSQIPLGNSVNNFLINNGLAMHQSGFDVNYQFADIPQINGLSFQNMSLASIPYNPNFVLNLPTMFDYNNQFISNFNVGVPSISEKFNFSNITINIGTVERASNPFNNGSTIEVRPSSQTESVSSENSSSLAYLRGKHWSEMTDSQLQQIYGNYTRDITSLYEGTADDLNSYLEGKGVLEGKGQAFIDAQNRYGISAAVLVGIAMNESARGTSSLARNKNNIGGVRIVGSTEFRTFDSVDACIMEIARFLKAGYVNNSGRPLTHLYQVNAKYCPTSDPTDDSGLNGYWARAVDNFAGQVEAHRA